MAAAALLCLLAGPAGAVDEVTEWSLLADSVNRGAADWHTLALMHQAMHDAANAAQPAYARWFPASAGEPPGLGASPSAAMAAAARRVMVAEHPDDRAAVEQTYQAALGRVPPGDARDAGAALGDAIGVAALARRRDDGFSSVRPFPTDRAPGRWRPTPPEFRVSSTTGHPSVPIRQRHRRRSQAPPAAGSPHFVEAVAEVSRLGRLESTDRSQAQTDSALYWAYQSSQRGYLHLAAALLDAYPRPGGMLAHARVMSQFAAAMADSAVLVWNEKERFGFWRPITLLREGAAGVSPDPDWVPLVETPPHPEYPSGHASDCYTATAVLRAVFPHLPGPVAYVAQAGRPPEGTETGGMGQHMQVPLIPACPHDGSIRAWPRWRRSVLTAAFGPARTSARPMRNRRAWLD